MDNRKCSNKDECRRWRISEACSNMPRWNQLGGAKVVERERKLTQRKYLEGVETLKQKNRGVTPLKNYSKMEQWQAVIYS